MNAPPNEVASQSETFAKRVLQNHESKIITWMAHPGHYRAVFSIDRPPLLAVGRRCNHVIYQHTPGADPRYMSPASWFSIKSATSAREMRTVQKKLPTRPP